SKFMKTMIFKYLKFRDNLFRDDGLILRASPRNDLNDPFEFLPPIILYEKIVEMHKQRKTSVPSYKQITQTFFNFHGAISFTESKSNLLMWSHYADEHRGVVLGFDNNHHFFSDLKIVKYDSTIPNDFFRDIDLNDNDALLKLFYIKSDEWAYEQEHRIVKDLIDSDYYIDNADNEVVRNINNASTKWKHFFVVPYNALLEVYLGCRMTASEKKRICKLLASKAKGTIINTFEAIQAKASLRLDFQEYTTIDDRCVDTEPSD
ncbi:MAG: DUF2971 domain-containing protein, partial [Candidatus Omnitrophota bacterium]